MNSTCRCFYGITIAIILLNIHTRTFYSLLENPKAFMVSYFKKLMDSRAIAMNYPCLFDDTNIKSLFGMLDVSNNGYINYEQYKRGILHY